MPGDSGPGAVSASGKWIWLGRVPFVATAALQEHLREEILLAAGPETLVLCEHDPVVTLGRSARPEHVLASPEELANSGVALAHASRGGDVTYHGPGQLVGYPIFRLRRGVLAHMEAMADALTVVLARLGIAARFRRDCPGLWVGDDKICAFGVHVRHRVAIHGFALNVTTDLAAFARIVPCGLRNSRVTSVAKLVGSAPTCAALAAEVAAAFASSFKMSLRQEATTRSQESRLQFVI